MKTKDALVLCVIALGIASLLSSLHIYRLQQSAKRVDNFMCATQREYAKTMSSTVYSLRVNPLAQISGTAGAEAVAPTYASAIVLDPNAGLVQLIAGVAATSATSTVTTPNVGQFGQLLIVIVTDTGGVTVTFGTGFKPTGTVNPTTGKAITVAFVSDGTVWREFSRSASAQ